MYFQPRQLVVFTTLLFPLFCPPVSNALSIPEPCQLAKLERLFLGGEVSWGLWMVFCQITILKELPAGSTVRQHQGGETGGAETSPEWTCPLTQLRAELAFVLEWGPYKSQLIYWYCFHLSVLYSSVELSWVRSVDFHQPRMACIMTHFVSGLLHTTLIFAHHHVNATLLWSSDTSSTRTQLQLPKVYKIVTKWKQLHKETSCRNLKIWGQYGNAKIKWKMDKNTLKIVSEKGGGGGMPWEETAATLPNAAECTFLWFPGFLHQQEPRTPEM